MTTRSFIPSDLRGMIMEDNPYALSAHATSIVDHKEEEFLKSKLPAAIKFEDGSTRHDQLYNSSLRANNFGLINRFDQEAKARAITAEKKGQNNKDKQAQQTKITAFDKPKTKFPDPRASAPQIISKQVKEVYKEKRETVKDFVSKKREIFLANMMINIKKEETKRLREFITNEEQTLDEHDADLREDTKFSQKWIEELKTKSDEAQKKAEEENEKKVSRTIEKDQIIDATIQYEKKIEKGNEELASLKEYKVFIDDVCKSKAFQILRALQDELENTKTRPKPQPASKVFMTNVETKAKEDTPRKNTMARAGTMILDDEDIASKFDNPSQLIQLMEMIEEENHFAINNAQEAQDEYDKARKTKEEEIKKLTVKHKSSSEQVDELRKRIAVEQDKHHRLRARKQILENTTEVKLDENEVLKIDIIQQKILEIYSKILNKKAKENDSFNINGTYTEDALLDFVKAIEKTFDNLFDEFRNIKRDAREKMNLEMIEKEIDQRNTGEKVNQRKQQEEQKREKMRKEKEKKNENIKKRIGRKDIRRSSFHEREEIDTGDDDIKEMDDERFFADNFQFSNGLKHEKAEKTSNKTRSINNLIANSNRSGLPAIMTKGKPGK
jgi:hypothetical protein